MNKSTGKSLDFNIRFNSLERRNFIQRFTSVYMFLENIDGSGDVYCSNGVSACCGCGGGNCEYRTAVNKQTSYFFLFNTMTGNSALRFRIDGKPSEMQRIIGDTEEKSHGCGSDFTADFLFGYAGYNYRICTAPNEFKSEIIASVNAGKPVIAEIKSGEPRFYVITGYDGENLLCPDFCYVEYVNGKGNVLSDAPETPPTYSELERLYIFGDKTERRYTAKDGLENIRRVMECNLNENIWNDYLQKINETPLEKQAELVKRLSKTTGYVYNFVSFCNSICVNIPATMREDFLYKELFGEGLAEYWRNVKVISFFDDIAGAGHKINEYNCKNWLAATPEEINDWSKNIYAAIEKAKSADIKLLDIIKKAIEIAKSSLK